MKKLNSNILVAAVIIALTMMTSHLFAQTTSPGIFFQAVARDSYSNPAKDRNIHVQSSIIQTTATGTVVLKEEFTTNTDATGVFAVSIGQGSRVGGTASNLSSIDWSKGPYFLNLKVAITPTAPTISWNYANEWIDLGTTSFGSVPYALYAGSVAGLDNKLNIVDTTKMLSPYVKATNLATVATSGSYNDLTNKPTTNVNSIGNISGTSNSKGATITSGALSLTPADGSNGGIVTTGTQVFAGVKTFNDGITFVNNVRVNGLNLGLGAGTQSTIFGNATSYAGNNATAIGFMSQNGNTGVNNTSVGSNTLRNTGSGSYNTAVGSESGQVVASYNTFIGASTNGAASVSNSTALGYGANVSESNMIQLGADGSNGTTAVAKIKTSAKIMSGAVTYPNIDGTNGQVLTTNGSGTASWNTPTSISVGTISSTSNANGATITSGVLTLTPADANNGGVVTSGIQTIGGAKTFLANFQVDGSANFTSNMLVGSGSSNSSAILTANSTTQGFLPPRLTIAQRDAIANPAQGLVLYCVNCGQYGELEVYNGNNWTNIVGGVSSPIFQDKVYHYSPYSSVNGVYSFNGTTWSSVVTIGMPSNFYGDYYVGKIGNKSYYYVNSGSTYVLYSFDGSNWVSLSIDKPSWFYGSSYLGVVGNKVYHQRNVWNNSTQKNDAEFYTFDGTSWTLISTVSDVRYFSSSSYVGVVNNKIYHFQNIGTTSDNFKLFEFNGAGWTMLSNAPPQYFNSSSYLGTINNKVYHFRNIGTTSNNFKVFEFDGTTWTMLSVAPPDYFGNSNYLGVIGNKGYYYKSVWNPATSTSENYIYQFDGLNWTTVSGTNYPTGAYFGGWLNSGMMFMSSSLIN